MLTKRKTDTLHCFSAEEFTALQINLTKNLWLQKDYLIFLFENTDRRRRKDDTCRDEINSEFLAVPVGMKTTEFLAVPVGTSVWKMLLPERALFQGDSLHVSLLLKKHCKKTIRKINDIEKQTVIMDFSIWNSYSNKEVLSDFNHTKINLLTEEYVGVY